VRQLYYLMNFFLEQGHMSSLCWMDMLEAAVYVMNRQPHPQSAVKRRQVQSPYELAYRRKPDLSDRIAAPWLTCRGGLGRMQSQRRRADR